MRKPWRPQEVLVVLGMHAERDRLTDQAQRARRGPAGGAERPGFVDEVPHVVGDLRAVGAELVHRVERRLDGGSGQVHRDALPDEERRPADARSRRRRGRR